MAFTPKLLFSRKMAAYLPVWEIVDEEKDTTVYYERVHHDGYIPIGCLDTFVLNGYTACSFETVKRVKGKVPYVYMVADGFHVPASWYRKDPLLKSKTLTVQHKAVDKHLHSDSE